MSGVAAGCERGIETLHGNVEDELPFDAGSFDVVVAGEMLEHVRAPEEVVAEVRRVLRPRGTFVGSVPNAYRLQKSGPVPRRSGAGRRPDAPAHVLTGRDPWAAGPGFATSQLSFVGGRLRRLHPRLLARDLVFVACREL